MYLYGASGHAKVIIDILRANGVTVDALFDDNEALNELSGLPVFRSLEVKGPLIISIGSNAIRKKIATQLQVEYGRAMHPSAMVAASVVIEEGTVVMHGAIVQAEAKVGKHCIINTAASVDHECIIGDFVHISPHSTLCGNVQVGEGSWIGAGTTVIPGVKIGKWCVIGAGSVVTKDVPDYAVAVGSPTRIIKYQNK